MNSARYLPTDFLVIIDEFFQLISTNGFFDDNYWRILSTNFFVGNYWRIFFVGKYVYNYWQIFPSIITYRTWFSSVKFYRQEFYLQIFDCW